MADRDFAGDASMGKSPLLFRRETVWRAVSDALERPWPYLLAALIALIAKAPTVNNGILQIDEVNYLLEGQRLNSLYTFVYSFQYNPEYKFQLGLLPFIAAAAISHEQAIFVLHFFGLLAVLASALLMVLVSRTAFQTPVPGLIAALLWSSFLNRGASSAAVLLEYFQVPLLLAAMWLFLKAVQDPTRGVWFLWSGFFVGLAALVKPPGIMMAPILATMVVVDKRTPLRSRLMRATALSAGVAVPLAAFMLPYLFNAEAFAAMQASLLVATPNYVAKFPIALRVRLLVWDFPGEVLVIALVCIVRLATVFVSSWRRPPDRQAIRRVFQDPERGATLPMPSEWTMLAVAAALFLGYLTGQAKPHYLIPVIPFTALFIARWFATSYAGLADVRLRVAFATAVVLVLVFPELPAFTYYGSLFNDNGRAYGAEIVGLDRSSLVRYIRAHTNPEDSIWVYYDAPEIYWLSDRRMATDDPYGASGARDNPLRMRNSIERDRPALIVGITEPRYQQPGAVPLQSIPLVNELLVRDYNCDNSLVPGTTICRRHDVVGENSP